MLLVRTVNLILGFAAILVLAGNASAQPTPIAFNSIPHPAAKLNALIGYRSKLIAGNADGIFVSADNGQTWVAQNNRLPSPIQVFELVTLNNLIFAATDKGLWKSDNEAQSWSDATPITLTNQTFKALHIMGSNIFAGTSTSNYTGKIMLSSDFGQSWIDVTPAGSSGLSLYEQVVNFSSVGNTIFALSGNQRLYKSSDNGKSWRVISGWPNIAIATSGPIMYATGIRYATTGRYALRLSSTDLGDSWYEIQNVFGRHLLPEFYSLVVSGTNILFLYNDIVSGGCNPNLSPSVRNS